jgi:uncharacterized protein YjbJ (UPF0337 family)
MWGPTLQKWEGRWEQLVGRVKHLWGGLIANEHLQLQGREEAAIGARKEHVGMAREEFEELLHDRAGP